MKNKKKAFFFLEIIKRIGMVGRLLILILICGCVIGYTVRTENARIITYDASEKSTVEISSEETSEATTKGKYLAEDETFEECFVMISNAGNKGRATTRKPGSKKSVVSRLGNGTMVWAVKKGTYKGQSYYLLEDDTYLLDEDEYVLELKSYTRLAGYVNITLVSSNGVKLRAWANFDDDNVVKRAFVGDQIKIVGKVVTKYGEEAYRTDEGLYMTTNSAYYEDHIAEVGAYESTATKEEEDSFE